MSMGLGRLLHRKRTDRDLDEEIQAHLAMATRDRIERVKNRWLQGWPPGRSSATAL